ncbi:hypothetical protein evm_014323 [Chilo suppressalis]|nr:hypothetical protein evm_014323 [Chilo suppressalis]
MKGVLCVIILLFQTGPAFNQVVRNVRFLQHSTYMLKVVEETVHDIENNGWCNLKIPDINENIRYSTRRGMVGSRPRTQPPRAGLPAHVCGVPEIPRETPAVEPRRDREAAGGEAVVGSLNGDPAASR